MTRSILIIICLLLTNRVVKAQELNILNEEFPTQIHLSYTDEPIILDGELNEEVWKNAEQLDGFSQYFPSDTASACAQTQMFLAYDDEFVYVAAKCYAPAGDFLVSSLKRDYGFRDNDNISFLFDTYRDKTNCYLFGMNAYGARREALISNGGKTGDSFDSSWDNKWNGESKQHGDYWICELAIPFNILRFEDGNAKWRFNAYRNDTQCNEISTWINIPREYVLMDMNYMGEMNWEKPLKKPGRNISLIPFTSSSITRDFEDETQTKSAVTFSAGGDAKISLSTNLNLDLTVNPDFSQVEVDRQVTNLNRFEIFFPERRQFFLENADLFSRFGGNGLNPFFSRRIGISQDTTTGNTIQNTIYGGARLAGKINDRLRVGLISMQTAAQRANDLPSYNYSILAAEQTVQDRSSIAVMFVNKEAFGKGYGDTYDSYDRLVATEYRLKSKNNFWTGKVSYMQAITPNDASQKFAHFSSIDYNKPNYRIQWEHGIVGDGFDAEVGFVPRRDIFFMNPEFSYRVFPKSAKIVQHTFSLDANVIYKLGKDDNEVLEDFGVEESGLQFRWDITTAANARMSARIDHRNITLLSDFDPTRIQEEDIFLLAGTKHNNTQLTLNYSSDRRKKVFWSVSPLYGKFFGGDRFRLNGRATYRHVPYGSLSVELDYNRIELGGEFEQANLWLIGPRLDITFTRKHFFSTFVQYNNQLDNVSINTRFQWRFAPASDFFLVYSDNYSTNPLDNLTSRNRGIVAKLTYWLNL